MTQNLISYQVANGFVAGFLAVWSAGRIPTKAKLEEAATLYLRHIPYEVFATAFSELVGSQKLLLSPDGLCAIALNRTKWLRLEFTPNLAVGFVIGGLTAAYSPIEQVAHLRIALEKIWPTTASRQVLYDAIARLRRERCVVSSSYGSDVDQWYLSLPKDVAMLEKTLAGM